MARKSLPSGPVNKETVRDLLAAGWSRVIANVGRGTFADKCGVCTDTVGNALAGRNMPELHTAFNSLMADPTALDELAALYGFQIIPAKRQAANDLNTAAGVIEAMGELVKANADGNRDHNETLAVAQMLRPHLGPINAIMEEADRLRGAA